MRRGAEMTHQRSGIGDCAAFAKTDDDEGLSRHNWHRVAFGDGALSDQRCLADRALD